MFCEPTLNPDVVSIRRGLVDSMSISCREEVHSETLNSVVASAMVGINIKLKLFSIQVYLAQLIHTNNAQMTLTRKQKMTIS